MNQRPDLLVDLQGEVLRDGGKGGIGPGIGGAVPADEPVGNVDVVGPVLLCAVLLEEVGHLDAQFREFRGLLAPGVVAVNVREGGDGTAFQHVQPGIELGLPAGGQPDELGDEAGADDGGLLGLNQGYRFLGEEGQQVLAEEALGQRPFLRELAGVFEEGVYPGDAAFGVLVLDAVAGVGVVFHDFAGAASALNVYLVEDNGTVAGDTDAVFLDEGGNGDGVEEGAEEGAEIGVKGGADAPGNDVGGDGVHPFTLVHLVHPVHGSVRVDRRGEPGMVVEVFPGRVVVAAGGFMVAAADVVGQGLIILIDIEREAAFSAATGAGVAATYPRIFLELILVFHCFG